MKTTKIEAENFFSSLGLHELVDASRADEKSINEMQTEVVYKPQLVDLFNLYKIVRETRRTTILEFGVGWRSLVLGLALQHNKKDYGPYVHEHLRRNNAFEVHSLDDEEKFIAIAGDRLNDELRNIVTFHYSSVQMTCWNGRICTQYEVLPLISPDFIYLDGPDQFNVNGSISGWSTAHRDMMPMACDVLKIEHFFVPGTILLIDGRGANARFLKSNLQRDWVYDYDASVDQHKLVLAEEPLGPYSRRQLDFQGQVT